MSTTYAGRGAGAFGALGGSVTMGGIIETVWVPDPKIIAAKILELAGYLENFIPPLEASREVARADMQNHFDTESGPSGAWAALSSSYVATTRGGAAHPILQLSGAMHAAAVSDSAYIIDEHDLFFSTAGLPFYWVFHETGRASQIGEYIQHVRETLGVEIPETAGGGMPARPFVGLSLAAEDLIIEVFDAWFAGGVSGFYVHGGGTVQSRVSGGFGPKLGGLR